VTLSRATLSFRKQIPCAGTFDIPLLPRRHNLRGSEMSAKAAKDHKLERYSESPTVRLLDKYSTFRSSVLEDPGVCMEGIYSR
jgi:hypothetical protein